MTVTAPTPDMPSDNGEYQPPAHFGPVPQRPPLTEAEVMALPSGTVVTVAWSGRNGPHDYVLSHKHGVVYADAIDGSVKDYNPLDFIGAKHFHTRVWVASIAKGGEG